MQYYDVFVYGTLRRGGTNHSYLEKAECLNDHLCLSGFRLYDFSQQYPFMVPTNKEEEVIGEVYRVNEEVLKQLNVLEDVQNKLYKWVYLEDQSCFTYIKYDNDVSSLNHIRSGDWFQYINSINI